MQITAEPEALSEEWQSAVDELRREVKREGMPWSCAGGALEVALDEPGRRAALRFRSSAGREVERHVPSPRELVSTAEALLARTTPARLPRRRRPRRNHRQYPSPRAHLRSSRRPPAHPREPRFLAAVMGGLRFSAPTRAVWFAPELRATIPVEAWSVGFWLRYALPFTLDAVPKDFSMSQANLGLAAGRQLLASPVEVRLTVDPSIAVISMEGDGTDGHASGAQIDFQIGLGSPRRSRSRRPGAA